MEKRLKKNTMLGKIGKTRDTEMNLKKRRNKSKKKNRFTYPEITFFDDCVTTQALINASR